MRRAAFSYRKRFFLPGSWKPHAPLALLRLDAVTCTAEVSLNGRVMGKTDLPDVPCEVDVTKALRWDATNELIITVQNLEDLPLYREWTGPDRQKAWNIFSHWRQARLSGPVTLVVTSPVRVKSAVVLPLVSAGRLAVNVTVENRGSDETKASVRCRVLDGRCTALDLGTSEITVGAGECRLVTFLREWNSADPWQTCDSGSPRRYGLEVALQGGRGIHDAFYGDFGWREVSVKNGRLLLSGRPFGFWALRWEPVDMSPVEGADLFLRILGSSLNALHPHYGAVPREFYERADDMGFAVVPELHCGGKWNSVLEGLSPALAAEFFDAVYGRWFEELVNHPSIVLWCQEDISIPQARSAINATIGADRTRPVMYRDLYPLIYEHNLSLMAFNELLKDRRALFIQEFHEEQSDLIPPGLRGKFLERLDGALFNSGFLKAPLMRGLFGTRLPRTEVKVFRVRSRVTARSGGRGGALFVEDRARPLTLQGYAEEGATDLGLRDAGFYRIAKYPAPAFGFTIPWTFMAPGDTVVPPVEIVIPE
jgi:hypothetical protein